MLKINSISISFGGKKVLNSCSMDIKENSITSLVGPNGCGKTTLFNIISGIIKAQEGKIIYKNKNILNTKIETRDKLKILRTFQDPGLFKNLTVNEHMILAANKKQNLFENFLKQHKINKTTQEKIEQILKDLNLYHKTNTQAKDLSGGQRKLLDLAMLLIKDSELILLDEPTAGVAPELKQLIKQTILKLKEKGKTIFLIEHDMSLVMNISDEIIVLSGGKVLKKGKPKEIKKDKQVLEAYLGV